jgi:Fe-S cluster biogenesis protein NfuA/nitrite reductase/ring-hydroxylating ferredoxin subunit
MTTPIADRAESGTASAPEATRSAAGSTDTPSEFEKLAAKVDEALATVRALDPATRSKAMALKESIEAFHKLALTTMVKRLKDDEHGRGLLFSMVDAPEVYAILALHGIVRADLRTRVSRVIDMVRPYMESHGGDVELVDVQGDRVIVRLHGSCNGCSMSAVTLRNSVEEALKEHVPEISGVDVAPNEPTPALVTLESRTAKSKEGWVAGPNVLDVEETRPYRLDGNDMSAILTRRGNVVQAFRNVCAHQGLPLDSAVIDQEDGTLTCPWHGFRFDCISGECLTSPKAMLEPLPLRVDNGVVWVRLA